MKGDNRQPIVFGSDEAFRHLEEEGVVYTFRTDEKKPSGPVWVRRSRTGEKEFDATLFRVGHIDSFPEDLQLWADQSGFGTAEDWLEEIKEIHGEVPDSGYVFCVQRTSGIKLHDFDVEMTVTVPARSEEKAIEQIEGWEERVQNAIGGLSFVIQDLNSQGIAEDGGPEINTKVHCGGCGEQYETFEEAKECDCEKLDIEKGDNK